MYQRENSVTGDRVGWNTAMLKPRFGPSDLIYPAPLSPAVLFILQSGRKVVSHGVTGFIRAEITAR